MKLARRDVAAGVVALVAGATCVRLGIWQLDRLAQRQARNAEIRAARERPPLELGGTRVAADSAHQRRVVARGVFDSARERVWRARSLQGVPGVALVTPLRLADGSAILVDRGWAPSPDGARVDAAAYREPDTAVIEGLALRAPRGRGDVDPVVLTDSVPYPLLPFVIQQLPGSAGSALRRWPAPALGNGPHLSYAIQWFSFAAIIVVGMGALLRKSGRRKDETWG